MYRNIEEISGRKSCSSTSPKSKSGGMHHYGKRKTILDRWAEYVYINVNFLNTIEKDYNVGKAILLFTYQVK